MKTQAWKPAPVTADAKKEGLYVDEMVHFYESATRATSEIPAAAAFVMGIEFVARRLPFEIREVASQDVMLSSDGKNLEGSHSMLQAMSDSAVMLDGIVRRHLREFAGQIQASIQEAARSRALALAAPKTEAEPEVPAQPAASAQEPALTPKEADSEVAISDSQPGAGTSTDV